MRQFLPAMLLLFAGVAAAGAQPPIVAGWIERVGIKDPALVMHGKLDTGARHTSINAVGAQTYQRDGRTWVRFTVRNREGQSQVIDRPVVREAKIRRHFAATQVRPVIRLTLCLAGREKEVDVNLVDRAKFRYQLLVGRSFLEKLAHIDSAAKYAVAPDCAQ